MDNVELKAPARHDAQLDQQRHASKVQEKARKNTLCLCTGYKTVLLFV
jgi:xanthine dehydrogenase iron-sulfur cluster and FAD-binding subunit A